MIYVELSLKRETKLVIGQKMYQSMSFLQMGADELDSCLNELSMENPLLDAAPPREEYMAARPASFGVSKGGDGRAHELPVPDKVKNTLRMDLDDQLLSMDLEPELRRAVSFLIINLDDRGYITDGVLEAAERAGLSGLMEKALKLLQSMEPAGVGARNLSECLCIQLERSGCAGSAAYQICRDYLDHLAKNHINHISRALGLPEREIAAARETIAGLNPIPSNGYDDGRCTVWATPDVELRIDGGRMVLECADRYASSYSVNSFYVDMIDDDGITEPERDYLREKLSQAQWVLGCVKRRNNTLLRCAREIAQVQKDFFLNGSTKIRPCYMADIAYRIGVHPSTVSRAIKNKYISCPRGVFPLSQFFSPEVCGDSADSILQEIRRIISGENPLKPYSDSAICKKLGESGYEIARRTVAKYRDAAGIAPATGRKQRKD